MQFAAITRRHERALMVGLALAPAISIFSATPPPRFEDRGFHAIVISVATLIAGFTLIYASRGLLTRIDERAETGGEGRAWHKTRRGDHGPCGVRPSRPASAQPDAAQKGA
jgi:hypothetical protein